ncbi:MAG: TraR/DksA family transcriptional regulator [Planctomycetota bacterium]|nr:MAG: TraR/DksA family transcriptional regulator [Planctomycetota bacterium]
MTKAGYQQYREKLLQLRARIRAQVDNLADSALNRNGDNTASSSNMPIHMADLGSDNFEQEFDLVLAESEGEVLRQIDEALERIDEGTYGVCAECGCKIPKVRLNAIPYTAHCVQCAEKLEERS